MVGLAAFSAFADPLIAHVVEGVGPLETASHGQPPHSLTLVER
jgi:hypothetical protein